MSKRKWLHTKQRRSAAIIAAFFFISGIGLIYAADSLDAGNPTGDLVAHYRFEGAAGSTIPDVSDNENDATLNGGTRGVDGVFGTKAIDITPNAEYITYPNLTLTGPGNSWTVSFWTRLDGLSAAEGEQSLWHPRAEYDYTFVIDDGSSSSADEIVLYSWDGSRNVLGTGVTASADTWYHLAITHEGGTNNYKIYVNGMKEADGNIADPNAVSDQNYFGTSDNNPTNGRFDEVRIYQAALNTSQIKSLYNQGSSFRTGSEADKTSNNILDISFDKWNNTHTFDTSGNNNHGTPQNGAEQKTAVHCKVGRCYDFSRTQGYVDLGNRDALNVSGSTNLTMMAWVNWNGTAFPGSSEWRDALHLGGFSALITIDDDVYRVFYQSAGDTNHNLGTITPTTQGVWEHITGVFNDTHFLMYRNGRLENSMSLPAPIEYESQFTDYIGGRGTARTFPGKVDQVKIFNRSLSQQEIIEEAGIERDGAVLDLRFDSGTGPTAHDSSMYGNDGTLSLDESSGPQWTDGVSGNALEFDGSDDQVTVSHSDELDGTAVTVAAWIRADSMGSDYRTIVHKGSDSQVLGNEDFTYNFRRSNTNVLEWNINTSGSGWVGPSAPPIGARQGEWIFVTGTANGTHARIYIDGELVNEAAYNGDITESTYDVKIGNPGVDDDVWNGALDHIKVYPYALSQSRINQLYNRGNSRIGRKTEDSRAPQDPGTTGLVGYWGFDNGNATHTFDLSGEVNHGGLNDAEEKDAARCRLGRCVSFPGNTATDNYVDVADDPSLNSDDATVSLWVKPEGNNSDVNYQSYVGKDYGDQWMVGRDRDTKQFRFHINTTGTYGTSYFSNDYSFTLGNWYHLAFTYDSETGNWSRYVNTNIVGSDTLSGVIGTSNAPLQIGDGPEDDNLDANATVDEVRVYNRSLSNPEIWHLYTQGRDHLGISEMAGSVAWYRLDNGTGQTAYDYSGEGYDGTRGAGSGSSSDDPTWTTDCKRNSCLRFDGSDDFVDSGVERNITGKITVAMWAKFNNLTPTEHQVLASSGYDPGLGVTSWEFKAPGAQGDTSTDDYIRIQSFDGTAHGAEVNKSILETGKWYHLTGVYNGSEWRIYKNGEDVTESTYNDGTGALANTQPTYIGAHKDGTNTNGYFNGSIDDVRIYPYALTQEQVEQVMNRGGTSIG